jgi:hypothetical protein
MRQQGHALRVGRKSALARSLDRQIGFTIWLRSLTPKTIFRHHPASSVPGLEPWPLHWRRAN